MKENVLNLTLNRGSTRYFNLQSEVVKLEMYVTILPDKCCRRSDKPFVINDLTFVNYRH